MNNSRQLVDKLWNYCNVLRDDGVSYGDYVEQLTYLLFLKMDDERVKYLGEPSAIPAEYNWDSLVRLEGAELEEHYRNILNSLGKGTDLIADIFRKSQNRIQDPAKLKRLLMLINDETWSGLKVDIKGEIYEGLLEKNAQDIKSGAGQYFTPRPLIEAMVDVMKPTSEMSIADPAAGTGGFLLAAHRYILDHHTPLNPDQRKHLRTEAFRGWELVNDAARLGSMNMYLHGVIPHDGDNPMIVADSLLKHPGQHFDMVLTNPPFGRQSSFRVMTEESKVASEQQVYVRDDFWKSTSNKQLNFVQHVRSILKQHGQAAVVVPDNVLFEGGAGEEIRRKLLHETNLHTLLRLPTGIFYAQGVKANVIFFDRKPGSAEASTKTLWIYDLRTNTHYTRVRNPIERSDFDEFVELYLESPRQETWSEDNPDGHWRAFDYEELINRDKVSLDIFWIRDESLEDTANLPDPDVLALDIVEDLEAALELFSEIAVDLGETSAD